MAAVLTITMTMRIILSVRGSLAYGGTFAGSSSAPSASGTSRSHPSAGGRIGTGTGTPGQVFSINPAASQGRQTYTLEEMRAKAEGDWDGDVDGKSSLNGGQPGFIDSKPETETPGEVSSPFFFMRRFFLVDHVRFFPVAEWRRCQSHHRATIRVDFFLACFPVCPPPHPLFI
jgi:hypothetical protein